MSGQPPGPGTPPLPPAEPPAETPVDNPPPPPATYTPQPSYPPPLSPSLQYGTPPAGEAPPPIVPVAAASSSGGNLMNQFRGPAGWSVLIGIISVAVPLVLNRVFYVLPIAGFLVGIRATMRGRIIGGVIGIVLNAIGGLPEILALVAG